MASSGNIHTPHASPTSVSTQITTPDQSQDNDNNDYGDDIWASDSDHNQAGTDRDAHPPHHEVLSDLPSIRRQHVTDGYREGLAIGKAKVMQQGFDEGYPIGMNIALRVGKILGVLEGYLAADIAHTASASSSTPVTNNNKSTNTDDGLKTNFQKLYERAQNELSISTLLRDTNDEMIAAAGTIPDVIEVVLSKWEGIVLGTDVLSATA